MSGLRSWTTSEVQRLQKSCRRNCWVLAAARKSERQLTAESTEYRYCCAVLADRQVAVRPGRLEDRPEVDGQGQVEERDHHVASRLRNRWQVRREGYCGTGHSQGGHQGQQHGSCTLWMCLYITESHECIYNESNTVTAKTITTITTTTTTTTKTTTATTTTTTTTSFFVWRACFRWSPSAMPIPQ